MAPLPAPLPTYLHPYLVAWRWWLGAAATSDPADRGYFTDLFAGQPTPYLSYLLQAHDSGGTLYFAHGRLVEAVEEVALSNSSAAALGEIREQAANFLI